MYTHFTLQHDSSTTNKQQKCQNWTVSDPLKVLSVIQLWQVFKIKSICFHNGPQPLSPLVNGLVNN